MLLVSWRPRAPGVAVSRLSGASSGGACDAVQQRRGNKGSDGTALRSIKLPARTTAVPTGVTIVSNIRRDVSAATTSRGTQSLKYRPVAVGNLITLRGRARCRCTTEPRQVVSLPRSLPRHRRPFRATRPRQRQNQQTREPTVRRFPRYSSPRPCSGIPPRRVALPFWVAHHARNNRGRRAGESAHLPAIRDRSRCSRPCRTARAQHCRQRRRRVERHGWGLGTHAERLHGRCDCVAEDDDPTPHRHAAGPSTPRSWAARLHMLDRVRSKTNRHSGSPHSA